MLIITVDADLGRWGLVRSICRAIVGCVQGDDVGRLCAAGWRTVLGDRRRALAIKGWTMYQGQRNFGWSLEPKRGWRSARTGRLGEVLGGEAFRGKFGSIAEVLEALVSRDDRNVVSTAS